jgi:hypothetical protein
MPAVSAPLPGESRLQNGLGDAPLAASLAVALAGAPASAAAVAPAPAVVAHERKALTNPTLTSSPAAADEALPPMLLPEAAWPPCDALTGVLNFLLPLAAWLGGLKRAPDLVAPTAWSLAAPRRTSRDFERKPLPRVDAFSAAGGSDEPLLRSECTLFELAVRRGAWLGRRISRATPTAFLVCLSVWPRLPPPRSVLPCWVLLSCCRAVLLRCPAAAAMLRPAPRRALPLPLTAAAASGCNALLSLCGR